MSDSASGVVPHEKFLALLLCLLAALRVAVFSAAFPVFTNVDEQSHFDLVCKYARGHIPTGLEPWDVDAARLILLHGSPEYFEARDRATGAAAPRPRRPETAEDRAAFERAVAALVATENHESTQPPVYYLVAGAWYRIGTWIGLRGLDVLHWTRLLNAVAYALVTWLAYAFARTLLPAQSFLRLGVPLLVACFPQDVFFSINNDVFLPVVTGAAFLRLLLIGRGASKGLAFHVGTGLLVAAAFLVKLSSVALLPVAVGLVVLNACRRRGAERKAAVVNGAVLLGVAALPIAAWCARNYVLLGDATASVGKTQLLGWTLKPASAIFGHPLFTLSGMVVFWRDTLVTFWRGELVWGLKPLASPGWDQFYAVSSFALVAVALLPPRYLQRQAVDRHRSVLWPSAALFLLSLAFLASISVLYDFGDCAYPSRAKPFMSSGRLALGALIPFAALYVTGLDALLPSRLPSAVRWTVLLVPVALMNFSEILLSRVAFESAYNWFHMK